MKDEARGRRRRQNRIWLALGLVLALLLIAIVPPLVSVNRFKSRITSLMSESVGRPVRLSSVEARLLPAPGFVLTDLVIEEDPDYGAEPVLRAGTVTANIRLMSLWRGRLEIGRISVDEASLNLVRSAQGKWNLDSLFSTATARTQPPGAGTDQKPKPPLPYLEATNSRINIKNGVEKLPFSLVDTDLAFWQEQPGEWRVRLRGEPARTDQSLDLAGSGDTGVVRFEARARRAAELRDMPLHIDMSWRDAQLGQLTRLLIGSDSGWRGALTGELHLDGTADAARIETRLRASGVHREEFAPVDAMDFDARCDFQYHFSSRGFDNLLCDSPLGDGHIRVAGASLVAGSAVGEVQEAPHLSVEMDKVPVAAALDALRTLRSGFAAGMEVKGVITGKMSYLPVVSPSPDATVERQALKRISARPAKATTAPPGPLTGSVTIENFQLSGDALRTPIQAAKIVLSPATSASPASASSQPPFASLVANASIPAGGAAPLSVVARLQLSGYQVNVRGPASIVRAREFAKAAGVSSVSGLDGLAGEPITVDLTAQGPWMLPEGIPFNGASSSPSSPLSPSVPTAPRKNASLSVPSLSGPSLRGSTAPAPAAADHVSGTVTVHNALWKADYLANRIDIAEATLHLDDDQVRWDPVDFSYGPVKGTATLDFPSDCGAAPACVPAMSLQFGALDAGALQAAMLGAREKGTLLSELISKLNLTGTSTPSAWPELQCAVKAESLTLGPITLKGLTATVHVRRTGAEITDLEATTLGGHLHGSGTLRTEGTEANKPAYTLVGSFQKLSPAAVGQLVDMTWSGGTLDAQGTVDLSGFADKELASSAHGNMHLDWRHGSVSGLPAAGQLPAPLARFDHWTGDVTIANGAITLKQNRVQQGSRSYPIEGTLTFGEPPKVVFPESRPVTAKR